MAKAEQDIEDFRLHTDFSRKIRPFNSTLTFVGNRTDMKRVGPFSTELEAQTNLSVYYDDDSQQVAIWTVTASKAEIETARKAFDQVTERLNSSGVTLLIYSARSRISSKLVGCPIRYLGRRSRSTTRGVAQRSKPGSTWA